MMVQRGEIYDYIPVWKAPEPEPKPEPKCHYLLRVLPNRETTVFEKLDDSGVSIYLPIEKRKVRSSWGQRVLRSFPIFPGILFVPDYDAVLPRLKGLSDGVVGFVTIGEDMHDERKRMRFAKAGPQTMLAIRNIEAVLQLPPSKRDRPYKLGQLVRIAEGPFSNWEGRIDRLDSGGRLKVLLREVEREILLSEDLIEAV